jgi:hypothetical protein
MQFLFLGYTLASSLLECQKGALEDKTEKPEMAGGWNKSLPIESGEHSKTNKPGL